MHPEEIWLRHSKNINSSDNGNKEGFDKKKNEVPSMSRVRNIKLIGDS